MFDIAAGVDCVCIAFLELFICRPLYEPEMYGLQAMTESAAGLANIQMVRARIATLPPFRLLLTTSIVGGEVLGIISENRQ